METATKQDDVCMIIRSGKQTYSIARTSYIDNSTEITRKNSEKKEHDNKQDTKTEIENESGIDKIDITSAYKTTIQRCPKCQKNEITRYTIPALRLSNLLPSTAEFV